MKQSRMDFNRQILVIIDNNPSSMHREYNEFYAVHVYLRSIRISLVSSTLPGRTKNVMIVIYFTQNIVLLTFLARPGLFPRRAGSSHYSLVRSLETGSALPVLF